MLVVGILSATPKIIDSKEVVSLHCVISYFWWGGGGIEIEKTLHKYVTFGYGLPMLPMVANHMKLDICKILKIDL